MCGNLLTTNIRLVRAMSNRSWYKQKNWRMIVCDTFRRSQTKDGVRVGNDFGINESPANSVTNF